MLRRISFALLCLAVMGVSLHAQTKGTISGFAKDPTDAAVPGVAVMVTNEGTGASRTTATDEFGQYQVLGLVSGLYTIEAETAGFKSFRNTAVPLTVDGNVRADIQLELGDVTEQIEVSAASLQVDTVSSENSSTITDRRIVDLPLSGRNVFALAKTIPGVLSVKAPDNSEITDARAGSQMNVNGGRGNMNYNRFNGAYFMNPSRNTGLNVPPPDAVQEFKIQTSNFAADTGRNPGGNVTIVSKQGTNEFHGSAWEFLRNDNLNARNFFEGRKPELKKNQYGVAAGGPMVKNKAFIFGTFEINDDRRQGTTTDSQPPSTAELAGDFSHLNGQKQLVNPFDGTTFPNNQIPQSLFDPAAQTILGFVPTVSQPGQTFQAFGVRPRDSELYMIRGDVNLTEKQTLFGTYYLNQNKDRQTGAGAFGTDFDGWTGRARDTRVQTASLNHIYTISPELLNRLTLSYTRSFSPLAPTVDRTPESLGIMGMPSYTDGGSPQFRLPGRFDLRSGGPVNFVSNVFQFRDDISVVKGRHTMRFGFEYMDIGWFQSFLGPPSFSFDGSRTGGGSGPAGDTMADFLLGAYESLPVNAGVRNNDDATTYAVLYIQDDFRITPGVTLNLGLRYEMPTPWVEKFDRLNKVVLDEAYQSTVVPQAPPGLLFPGDQGPEGEIQRGLVKTDRNNFAPRVGFAWDMFGDGRTAMRAAYGIFYETANGDTLAQANPPFTVGSFRYRDGLLSNPFGSINATPLPVSASPTDFSFSLPLNGLWGPISEEQATTSVQNWSFFLDREFATNYVVSIGYVGKKGQDLLAFRPFNGATFIPGNDSGGDPLSTRANIDDRVPFLPGVYGSGGYYLDNPFRSNYHAVQVELKKRFARDVQFNAAYTLSKSLDSSSTTNLV